MYVWLLAWCFVGLLTLEAGMSSAHLPTPGTLFLLLGCLSGLSVRAFGLSYCFSLVVFGCSLLEAWSFLKGHEERVDSGERAHFVELGEAEGGETMVEMYYMREESVFNFLRNRIQLNSIIWTKHP